MLARPLSSNEKYFLHILKNHEEIQEFFKNHSLNQKNWVLLYPKTQYGSSSTGACRYNACFIIQNTLLVDDNNKLIEVYMGDLSLNEVAEISERILQTALSLLEHENLPNLDQLLQHNRNTNLHEEKLPCLAIAHELAMRSMTEAAAIAAVLAKDLEQFDNDTTEHKTPRPLTRIVKHDKPTHSQKEIGPLCLPSEICNLILEYTANVDPETNKKTESYDIFNMPTTSQCARFTLFGKPYLDEQKTNEMTQLGSMAVHGCDSDVEIVIAEVKKTPALLYIVITVKDPIGTPVTGTLLQLAAMAGDIDLMPNIVYEKNRGLVQRLIKAGKIPTEEVIKQLQCINSQQARDEDKARIQRYLNIMQRFGNNLYENKLNLKDIIALLEKELLEERCKAVNAGFIFNPQILFETLEWFNKSGMSKDSAITAKFCIHGIGKLQRLLSSRDAQALIEGVWLLTYKRYIDLDLQITRQRTPRTLTTRDGVYFYSKFSELGQFFYIGCVGIPCYRGNNLYLLAHENAEAFKEIMLFKNQSIAQLVQSHSYFKNCSLM